MTSVNALINSLNLEPHPEGGWYREIHRTPERVQTGARVRSAGTLIYFLLAAGQCSRWHRVDADEMWTHVAGDPLELFTWSDPELSSQVLGTPPHQEGASVIPANTWQAARPTGSFALVTCVVAPGFEFTGFDLINPDHAEYSELVELPGLKQLVIGENATQA